MEAGNQGTISKRGGLESATYTLAEFAALHGISYTTAHERAQAGKLPITPIRIGRKYLFPKAAVNRLLCLDEAVAEPKDAA